VWGIFTSDTVAQPSKQVIRGERLINVDPRDYGNQAPKVMLMQCWQDRLELHDLVQKVAKTCKEMKVDRLLIEDRAAGHSVAQELRRLFGYEDFAVQLVNPGAIDKVARVYAIQHIFAEGMVFAPDRQWAEMTITQCAAFPRAKHDDIVDTVSQALTYMRRAGLLTRSAEHISEIGESLKHRGAPPQSLYGI
jgi:predicted phage terminase large subunit-like protein